MTFLHCRWQSLIIFFLSCVHLCSAFQVTGATGGVNTTSGERPSRTEISSFSQSGPAWHLFVLALFEMQRWNQTNPMSYFAIAGIHGYPQRPYDGVLGTGVMPGYCLHQATPFPTWHRPYLALFEQSIWTRAQTLASLYPPQIRAQYQEAARTLRIPYWDSTLYPSLPDAAINPWVTILTPSGNYSLPNPLYSYMFQSDAAGSGFPLRTPLVNLSSTVRYWKWDNPSGNQSLANLALQQNSATTNSLTYQLFASISDFDLFSCTQTHGQANPGNNIEQIHNNIHNLVGGEGHMSYTGLAAFDPIFWLHHANVDRLFAMWQALYSDSWMEPMVNYVGSYYEPPGTVDSGSSPLAPFHSDNTTSLFTSDDVRSTAKFGYTYPELPDWTMDPAALRAHVTQQVNQLYNPSPIVTQKRAISRPLRRSPDLARAFRSITAEEATQLGVNNVERQWSARISLDQFAHSTSFSIYFFMGDPPTDVKVWPTASNLIGSHGLFTSTASTTTQQEHLQHGQTGGEVSLTHVLVAGLNRGFIADLSPASVVPVLQRGLQWRARGPDGCEIDCSQLSGLSISVSSRPLEPTKDEYCFPKYGNVEWHPIVTQDKVGGAKQHYRLTR